MDDPISHRRSTVTPPAENGVMARQLTLIPAKTDWRLDSKTREAGLRGVAEARAALKAHRPSTGLRRSAA
jgi:hypothetical protein